jgi:acyl-CoA synthetase (AMP-forming)/AMP-acid ligase II
MADPIAGTKLTDISAQFTQAVHADPARPAVICPPARAGGQAVTVSFGDLDRDSDVLARGLLARGIGPGTRTALMVTPGPEFLAISYALIKAGAVPVLVDPGLGIKRLGGAFERAAPEAFIGVPRAHVARLLFGWAKRTIRTTVVVGGPRPLAGHTLAGIRRASGTVTALPDLDPGAPAIIAFTSGSTGAPKGVITKREQLASQLTTIGEIFGWQPGDVDLATMPLFALFATALGVTAILPAMDFTRPAQADPAMLVRLVQEYAVTTMFCSPALLEPLSRFAAARGERLTSLRRVICAGAPVQAGTLRRCRAMLADEGEVCTPYGATEALPMTTIESREILAETAAATDAGDGVCVGRAVRNADIEIIAMVDGPIGCFDQARVLPPGEAGEIVARAPWVSACYAGDPDNTMKAKIPAADGTFFHRTGDAGYRDALGRVWFCGRVADRVVTEADTLLSVPCEAVFNTHPAVFRSALTGPHVVGQLRPTMCVELEPGRHDHAALRRDLLSLAAAHEHTRAIRDVLFHPGLPVDVRHNAKIDHEALTTWAESRLQ